MVRLVLQTEYVVKCEMSALQRQLYRHLKEHGVLLTGDAKPHHLFNTKKRHEVALRVRAHACVCERVRVCV